MKACTFLEETGKQCWIAPRDIVVGAEYGEEIIKGIEGSNVVVLIFSEDSNRSQHVLREVERAVSKNIPIISYRIDQSELSKSMEYFLLSNQWLDAVTEPNVMFHRLNMSLDTLMNVKCEETNEVKDTKKNEVESHHKAVPILLGFIAIGVLAIAFILGTKLNNDSKEKEVSTKSEGVVAYNEGTKDSDYNGKNAGDVGDTGEKEETKPEVSDNAVLNDDKNRKIDTNKEEQPSNQEKQDKIVSNENERNNGKKEGNDVALNNVNKGKKNEVKDETKEDTQPVSQKEKNPITDIALGDYLKFANYKPTGYSDNNKDSSLIWQVINVDESSNTVRLITKNIIDIKPFDCAESGKFDKSMNGESYERGKKEEYSKKKLKEFRGSNVWASSDLCKWLNSTGNVRYQGIAPSDAGTDEYGNGFNNQSGFLALFTKKERSLLMQTKLSDGSNNLVYILSIDEIKKYMNTDYFVLHPQITQSAINSDTTSWYNAYKGAGAADYIWATRTADKDFANSIYIVNSSVGKDTFVIKYAAASGFGIRPVIAISLKNCELKGDGTEKEPYSIMFE